MLAGLILLSARPFKVGDRVRFQAGGIAGQVEGVVMGLGLLYVTLAQGEDTIMIPNNVAMAAAVVPLREPAAVDLRAHLKPDVKPSELQAFLEENVKVPTRSHPHISVDEVDDEEVDHARLRRAGDRPRRPQARRRDPGGDRAGHRTHDRQRKRERERERAQRQRPPRNGGGGPAEAEPPPRVPHETLDGSRSG